jgi:hypothetical protein
LGAEGRRGDPLHSPDHLLGGSAGKRQKQGAVRINPVDDQMRNPMGKSLRLPRPGASNHQQRSGRRGAFGVYTVLDRMALFVFKSAKYSWAMMACPMR